MSDDFYKSPAPGKMPKEALGLPGLGLAGYSCLLLVGFLIGFAGILGSTLAILQSSFQRDPFSLVPGNQVPAWRLQPMRDAKLLGYTDVPIHYHDETSNGTKACAIVSDAVLRLDGGDTWKIPFTAIDGAKTIREGSQMVGVVATKDGETLPCFFESGEGVERFVIHVREFAQEAQKEQTAAQETKPSAQ
ncbi:MAG: hypothetical protein CMK59_10775 [Proteobacteria bacterium]|nr:hypothetical protein [Pseudomonadota bacterium]